jgi:hypothetical protein
MRDSELVRGKDLVQRTRNVMLWRSRKARGGMDDMSRDGYIGELAKCLRSHRHLIQGDYILKSFTCTTDCGLLPVSSMIRTLPYMPECMKTIVG